MMNQIDMMNQIKWMLLAAPVVLYCNATSAEQPTLLSQTVHSGSKPIPRPSDERGALRSQFLQVQGSRIVDPEGRQVLLHGMNVISKSKSENYLSWHRARDFNAMHMWGMNCIRLGILWDGIEPDPGQYDEAYLDGLSERIAWAEKHGLYVFLDMHQDLFSVLYSDGAPEWATLHNNQPHLKGAVWSDSYLISPAVHTAFDSFWANAAAADGVGIQDHYAAAWRHVAQRFADNTTVIGFDLMNEPFEGSSVIASQAALLQGKLAQMLMQRLGDQVDSPADIARLWLDPEGRQTLTTHLEDMEVYEAFVDAQQKMSQAFERNHLQPMFQRVANAIRSVDSRHILLLETSYHANAGVRSAIEPVKNSTGERDPQQLYAPHAYDIVVDTPALAEANTKRVELIFRRHGETAQRLKMPMLIGEWGAFGGAGERILPSALILQRQFEHFVCGDTYWDYGRDIEKTAYFGTLCRPIPCRIAGTLLKYGHNPETGEFICRWQEDPQVTAPTLIYITAEVLKEHAIELVPKGAASKFQPVANHSGNGYFSIPPTGDSIERCLTIK
jgi:endoglycosylceramidase